MDQVAIRKELIGRCRQVIVKAGTRLLSDHGQIARLVGGIAEIRKRGCRVLLVTSGAVGMGMQELGLLKRPRELSRVQALAAIGQCKLMAIYEAECRKHGFKSAQLLLNTSDFKSRERYLNVMNCINALWDDDVLPIINENDSVSIDELKFGDNDSLAGMLGTITGSQLTVILTTEQGLRERVDGKLGKRISVVSKLDQAVKDMAGGTDNAEFSIGGMSSKLKAAELVTSAGEYLWIADGREEDIVKKILDGEDVGTLFIPGPRRVPWNKRHLRYFAAPAGALVVDAGAAKALRNNGGSLLPSGVTEVRGSFKRGNSVDILDPAGVAVARGLANYTSAECDLIKGLHSSKLAKVIGHTSDAEVVHRDNLTLL